MEKSTRILEFVTLLWSHPFLAVLLIIFLTTPLCHVVIYFSPLLISTSLCVISLVSIGSQIEATSEERERLFKFVGLTFRGHDVERPFVRHRVFQRRRNPPRTRLGWGARDWGTGQRWTDWVRGIEIHGQYIWLADTHFMNDIEEEGLSVDFTDDDGGVAAGDETCSENGAVAAAHDDGVSVCLPGLHEFMSNLPLPSCNSSKTDEDLKFLPLNLANGKNHVILGKETVTQEAFEDSSR